MKRENTMTLGKVVLGVSSLVFITYGLVSLVSPEIPSGLAGLEMGNGDAFAEIGAMYGGLQTGIGAFCLLAVLNSEYYKSGLMLLAIGIGALALARLVSFGVGTEAVSAYTYGALAYEFSTAALATAALLKR